MTELDQEASEGSSSAKPEREKGIFAPVAILTLVLAPIVIAVSIFSNYSDVGNYTPAESNKLSISVVLSAPQFLEFSTGNICDGKVPIVGLSRAILEITAGQWSAKTPLGEGALNSQGKCEYQVTVTPDSTFLGGEIESSITFSFGKSQIFINDVGNSLPYKDVNLDISLG
jgi:hypothetical protein